MAKHKRKASVFNRRVGELLKLAKTAGQDRFTREEAFREAVRVVKAVGKGDITMAAARAAILAFRRRSGRPAGPLLGPLQRAVRELVLGRDHTLFRQELASRHVGRTRRF